VAAVVEAESPVAALTLEPAVPLRMDLDEEGSLHKISTAALVA
jgi:hypothetical protein